MRTIRTAALADKDSIAAVEAECFPPAEAATAEQFSDRLKHYADHFLLMFEDDRLVAFVDGFVTNERDLTDEMYENAALHDENGKWQMLFGVNTIPAYRRQGCAEELIERFIAIAKEQGRMGVVLTCKGRLIRYYEKFGFVNEGLTAKSTHGGAEWYRMRLTFED